jgi:hypothetical protein
MLSFTDLSPFGLKTPPHLRFGEVLDVGGSHTG